MLFSPGHKLCRSNYGIVVVCGIAVFLISNPIGTFSLGLLAIGTLLYIDTFAARCSRTAVSFIQKVDPQWATKIRAQPGGHDGSRCVLAAAFGGSLRRCCRCSLYDWNRVLDNICVWFYDAHKCGCPGCLARVQACACRSCHLCFAAVQCSTRQAISCQGCWRQAQPCCVPGAGCRGCRGSLDRSNEVFVNGPLSRRLGCCCACNSPHPKLESAAEYSTAPNRRFWP
jgi:hypothetical protein